jgi:O-antigen ligase
VAFTLVLLLSPQTSVPGLQIVRPAMLSAALAIGGYLSDRLLRRRPLVAAEREVWLAAGLVLWAVLITPFSYWPGGSMDVLKNMFIKSVAVFWIISSVVDTERRLRIMLWVLAAVGVPLGLTAVKHYLEGVFMGGSAVNRIIGFDAPLTANPNDLALMLMLILPLAVALGLSARTRLVRGLMTAVVVVLVCGVIATYSRAGFILMLTVFAIYVSKMLDGPKKGWALAVIVLALLCIPMLPASYLGQMETITDPDSDVTGSAQTRRQDAVAALRFIARSPVVGAGLGQHVVALADKGGTWRMVHNVYLETAADLGIPGLLVFLAMLWSCWRGVRRVQRAARAASPALFRMAEGIEVSLVVYAVGGMFHPISYHFYFYFIAGLAVAARVISRGLQGARLWAT